MQLSSRGKGGEGGFTFLEAIFSVLAVALLVITAASMTYTIFPRAAYAERYARGVVTADRVRVELTEGVRLAGSVAVTQENLGDGVSGTEWRIAIADTGDTITMRRPGGPQEYTISFEPDTYESNPPKVIGRIQVTGGAGTPVTIAENIEVSGDGWPFRIQGGRIIYRMDMPVNELDGSRGEVIEIQGGVTPCVL